MRSLPRIVSGIPNDVRNFLDRVRECLGEGGEGRFVTLKELRAGGIVGTTPNGTIIPPGEFGVENPSVPKNLVVTGAFATIIVEWDAPAYLGHAYTEVWAAATDDFTAKELVGVADGNTFSHSIGTGATRYYWIRFINKLDVAGPFNSTTGTVGNTSQDPDYLIEVLSDAYGVTGPAPFFQIDEPTTINGVLIPAGTYIKQAWIADATISRAKIQDLAVDSAKISDLSADKITTASLRVGAVISSQGYVPGVSGWQIRADGSAEFAQVSVRGTLYGGGAASYTSGTGLFAGLDSGTYKFRVGNPTGNRLQWDGTALTIAGTILGGSATAYLTGTGLFAGLDGGVYKFRVGNPSGAYIYWDGTSLKFSTNAADAVDTPNVKNLAISQAFVGRLTSPVAINTDVGITINLPSFTVPIAGKVVVQVVMQLHNFSTGTNRDVQIESFVNYEGDASFGAPIVRCFSSGTNSWFMPIAPLNSTAGNSVQISAVHELTTTGALTIPVSVGATAGATNTTLYLVDAYYIAVLYKK